MNILAYHGSPNEFEEFSFKKVGSESGTSGAGFGLYFSTIKTDALTYGENLYTCLLQLKNNISNFEVTFQPQIIKAILDSAELDGNSYYENYTGVQNPSNKQKEKVIRELLADNDSDVEIVGDLINSCYGGNGVKMMEILIKYGYTHTLDHVTPDLETITHYIVYDLNAITIQKIENLNTM